MFDPEIKVHLSATMQQLQRFVACGAYWHVTGTISIEKVAQFVQRLDERFELQLSDGQRDRRRKSGEATFRLVLYPLPGRTDFGFWILRGYGNHLHLSSEQWCDARLTPVCAPFLYELRQLPVSRDLRNRYRRPDGRIAINHVTWSWRFRPESMDQMRFNIRRWAEQRDERLNRLANGLSRAPGFRGIRADVFELRRYILGQCSRRDMPPPTFQPMPWVTGRRAQSVPLSYILRRIKRGAATWFPASLKRADTVITPTRNETPDATQEKNSAR